MSISIGFFNFRPGRLLVIGLLCLATGSADAGTDQFRRAVLRRFVADLALPADVKDALCDAAGDPEHFDTRLIDIVGLDQNQFAPSVRMIIADYLRPMNLALNLNTDQIEEYIQTGSISHVAESEHDARAKLHVYSRTVLDRLKIIDAADLARRYTAYEFSMRPGAGPLVYAEVLAWARRFGHPLRDDRTPRTLAIQPPPSLPTPKRQIGELKPSIQRQLKFRQIKDPASVAAGLTFLSMLRPNGITQANLELIAFVTAAGFPIKSGARVREEWTGHAEPVLPLRMANMLERLQLHSADEFPRRFSALSLMAQEGVGLAMLADLMDYALSRGHPLMVTEEERRASHSPKDCVAALTEADVVTRCGED